MLLILEFLFLAVLIVGPAILFITKETNTTPISGIIIWILLLYVFRRAIKKRKQIKLNLKKKKLQLKNINMTQQLLTDWNNLITYYKYVLEGKI